jgi:hypothetical protein
MCRKVPAEEQHRSRLFHGAKVAGFWHRCRAWFERPDVPSPIPAIPSFQPSQYVCCLAESQVGPTAAKIGLTLAAKKKAGEDQF